MKHLLASVGTKNASVRGALLDLLGKPIADGDALCIPTAAHPMAAGPGSLEAVRRLSDAREAPTPATGWHA